MSPDRKAGAIAFSVAGGACLLIFVALFASLRCDSKSVGSAKEAGKDNAKEARPSSGIDREKVLRHMTSESDTVIFFDDKGSVVSTQNAEVKRFFRSATENSDSITKHLMPFILSAGVEHVEEVKRMSGLVRFTYSARGVGKRFTREEASAILDDMISLQTPK